MKTPALFFSIPLLVSVLAAQAGVQSPVSPAGDVASGKASRLQTDADGNAYETRHLRIRGELRPVRIMADRVLLRDRTSTGRVHRFTGTKGIRSAASEGKRVKLPGKGSRADFIAYPESEAGQEDSKFLLTPKVTVQLMPGTDSKMFFSSSGAIRGKTLEFAPGTLVLTYDSPTEAMDAVERLSRTPGVVSAEQVIAVNREPEFLPTEQYLSPTGPPYQPTVLTDNVDTDIMVPIPSNSYAWWANNRAALGGPVNAPFSRVDLGDLPPIGYNPANPLLQGELADIRLPLAWEHMVTPTDRVSGLGQKIMIVDDGVDSRHPDFTAPGVLAAVDGFPQHHRNMFETNPSSPSYFSPLPQTNSDVHGTGLAGIIGARLHTRDSNPVGQGIVGIAPRSTIQAVVGIKGFIDDDQWAEAFVYGSTVNDTDGDGLLYDETTRTGVIDFHICLNASSESGSQAATRLFKESYLWYKAIKYGYTNGRQLRGVVYVTSAGNGAGGGGTTGQMDVNYMEQKNLVYQIPVGGLSDLGRAIGRSNPGAALVCVAPTWGDELPPLINWPGKKVNPPVGPNDIGVFDRRDTQGIMTTSFFDPNPNNSDFQERTYNHDPNFTGTSASAAQVAGIVALMLEINPNLKARDVKEILMRSCRVVNDVRVTYDGKLHPTQWRMGPMGRPFHPKLGAGLVDANRAIQITKRWTPLGIEVAVPDDPTFNPSALNNRFERPITVADRQTGSIYFGTPKADLIPTNGNEVPLLNIPGPFSTQRLEHVELRVQFYHPRRGDLEIKLVAPPAANWDPEYPIGMESVLFAPHVTDTNSTPYVDDNSLFTDWTFTSVRHWGMKGNSDLWKVVIRDTVSNSSQLVSTEQRLAGIGRRFHSALASALNDPPVIDTTAQVLRADQEGTTPILFQLKVMDTQGGAEEDVFPVTNWDLYDTSEICPVQMSNPPLEPFEFFPPGRRALGDVSLTPVLVPLVTSTVANPVALAEWPQRPLAPAWVRFQPLPAEGAYGALGCRPPWVTDAMLTANRNHLILRNTDKFRPASNTINMRLNRKTGTVEVVPLKQGKYEFKAYAENLLGLSKPMRFTILVGAANYTTWRQTYWAAPAVTDDTISGPLADPDGDGLQNAMEYTMRTDPTVANPGPWPPHFIEGNEIVFQWNQDSAVRDYRQLAQISTDLNTWTDVTPTQTGNLNGVWNLEYRMPIGPDIRYYFRLVAKGPASP